MKTIEPLPTLQLFYAGLLAESVALLDRCGLSEKVREEKMREDELSAPLRNEQFGITCVEEIFMTHRDVFGFSDWTVRHRGQTMEVVNTTCKLCAIAKLTGSVQPCTLCCIQPLNSLCRALEPPYSITAATTLWDSEQCCFTLHQKQ